MPPLNICIRTTQIAKPPGIKARYFCTSGGRQKASSTANHAGSVGRQTFVGRIPVLLVLHGIPVFRSSREPDEIQNLSEAFHFYKLSSFLMPSVSVSCAVETGHLFLTITIRCLCVQVRNRGTRMGRSCATFIEVKTEVRNVACIK